MIGRRLPALLGGAGLIDIGVDARTQAWQPADLYQKLRPLQNGRCRRRILSAGLLTEPELDACLHTLDPQLDLQDSFTLYVPLFQAWGRKPHPS